MTTDNHKLSIYSVTIATPQRVLEHAPADTAKDGHAAYEWLRAQLRDQMQIAAQGIEENILKNKGGYIIANGSGYGIPAHPDQYTNAILLATTKDGVAEIKQFYPDSLVHIIAMNADVDNILQVRKIQLQAFTQHTIN